MPGNINTNEVVTDYGLVMSKRMADALLAAKYERRIDGMECTKCNEHQAMHTIRGAEDEDLCCRCYVQYGYAPSDWHGNCMATDESTKLAVSLSSCLIPSFKARINNKSRGVGRQ